MIKGSEDALQTVARKMQIFTNKAGKTGQEDRPRSQPFWRKGNGKVVENRIKEDK